MSFTTFTVSSKLKSNNQIYIAPYGRNFRIHLLFDNDIVQTLCYNINNFIYKYNSYTSNCKSLPESL